MSDYTPPDLNAPISVIDDCVYGPPDIYSPIEVEMFFIDWSKAIFFAETGLVSTEIENYVLTFFIESLGISEDALVSLRMQENFTELVIAQTLAYLLIQVTLDENLEIIEELRAEATGFQLFLEQARAHTATMTRAELNERLNEAFAILSELLASGGIFIVERAEIDSTVRPFLRTLLLMRESLRLSSHLRLSISVLCDEQVNVSSAMDAHMVMRLLLVEQASFIRGELPDGSTIDGMVMNTTTGAVSTYPDLGAQAMVEHDGALYVGTAQGIYRMEHGAEDEIERVQARLVTGAVDFGTRAPKSVPYGYFYLTESGETLLRINARDPHREDARTYRIQPTRTQFDRAARGVWWVFELEIEEAENLEIEGADVVPVLLRNRR